MTTKHAQLPQLGDALFLMDGGLETTLVFHEGVELRDFASFELLNSEEGRDKLAVYYLRHAGIA